jgi:hypothetical protein
MTEPLFSAAIASYKGAQSTGAALDSARQELFSYEVTTDWRKLTRRPACHLNLT